MSQHFRSKTPNIPPRRLESLERIGGNDDVLRPKVQMNKTMNQNMRPKSLIKIRKIQQPKPAWESVSEVQAKPKIEQLLLKQSTLKKLGSQQQSLIKSFRIKKIKNNENSGQKDQNNEIIYQPGSLQMHKDELSNSFVVLKPITEEELDTFLYNVRDIQIKKNHQYQEIMNTAKELKLDSMEEILLYKDILLYALQGLYVEPHQWYNIMYWLSRQFYFFNSTTKEKSKRHPLFTQYANQISKRKEEINKKLPLVTELYLQGFIDQKVSGNNSKKQNLEAMTEDDRLLWMQCEKAIKDLQIVGNMDKIKICQNVILQATQITHNYEPVQHQISKKIKFHNFEEEISNNLNPNIENLRKECNKVVQDHNSEITNITKQDLQKFVEGKWLDKDKKDLIDSYIKIMGFSPNDSIVNHMDKIWNQIEQNQNSEWKPIRLMKNQQIAFQNANTQEILDRPPGLKNINQLYKTLDSLQEEDIDNFINKKPIDHEIKQVIDKILKDVGIVSGKEFQQNKSLLQKIINNPEYIKYKPIIYEKSKKVAFFNEEKGITVDKLPNLPSPDKFFSIPQVNNTEIQKFIDKSKEIDGDKLLVIEKCCKDIGIDPYNTLNIKDYSTLLNKMTQDLRYKAGKVGEKSRKIVFKDLETENILEEYPDVPPSDQIYNVVGQIDTDDIDSHLVKQLRNEDKREQINKYYKLLGANTEDEKFSKKNKLRGLIEECDPEWTLVKFAKTRKIMLMDENTMETREYPSHFPQESIEQRLAAQKKIVYQALSSITSKDFKNYIDKQKVDNDKFAQLEKYSKYLNLTTDEEKRLFFKPVGDLLDKQISDKNYEFWEYKKDTKSKKRLFVNSKNPLETKEYPLNFPSREDVKGWLANLNQFTEKDVQQYIVGELKNLEKKKELDKYLEKMKVSQQNKQNYLDVIIKAVVLDPVDNWERVYSLNDKKKVFKNRITDEILEYPPNFPSEEELANLTVLQISKISQEDLDNFCSGQNLTAINKDNLRELELISSTIGLKGSQQKQDFKQLLEKCVNFDENIWQRVKNLSNGQIQYRNKSNGELRDLPPNVPTNKSDLNNLHKDLDEITENDINAFMNGTLNNIQKQHELDELLNKAGINKQQIKQGGSVYKLILNKMITNNNPGFKRIQKLNSPKSSYLNKIDGTIQDKVPCLQDIISQLQEQSAKDKEHAEKLEKERILKEKEEQERLEKERQEQIEREKAEQLRLQKEREEAERKERERLEREQAEKEEAERKEQERLEQERLEKIRLEKEKQEQELKIQQMKGQQLEHFKKEHISQYVQNELNNEDDKNHIEIIFKDLQIDEPKYRKLYQSIPTEYLTNQKAQSLNRIKRENEVGYLDESNNFAVSPFPPGYPNKEDKEIIHVKMKQIDNEEIDKYLNGELDKDSESKDYINWVCTNTLQLKDLEQQKCFADLLKTVMVENLGDSWHRARKVLSKEVLFISEDSNGKYIQQQTLPNLQSDDELNKIYGQGLKIDKEIMQQFYDNKLKDKNLIKRINDIFEGAGIENTDEQLQFKDLIIDNIENYDQEAYKCIWQLKGKVGYLNTKTDKINKNPPHLGKLKVMVSQKRIQMIKENEKISGDRVDSIYKANFDPQFLNKELEVLKENPKGIKVIDKAGQNDWKIGIVKPNLVKQEVRRFGFHIDKMNSVDSFGIGICNEKKMDKYLRIKSYDTVDEDNFLLNSEGKIMVHKNQQDKVSLEGNITFNEGDIIIIEINLYDNEMEFTKQDSSEKAKLKFPNDEQHIFSVCAALKYPKDQLLCYSRSDFPVHVTLTWEDPCADLDLLIMCGCGKKVFYNDKRCNKCHTYLDKDHRYGKGPIEHVFMKNLPKLGLKFKYKVKYSQVRDNQKISNVNYNVAIYACHNIAGKDHYTNLIRKDGYVEEIGSDKNFKFEFKQEHVDKCLNPPDITKIEKEEEEKKQE